jgi:hypothetical protein
MKSPKLLVTPTASKIGLVLEQPSFNVCDITLSALLRTVSFRQKLLGMMVAENRRKKPPL